MISRKHSLLNSNYASTFVIRDSESASTFSLNGMYSAKIQTFHSSHHSHISLATLFISENLMQPIIFVHAIAEDLLILSKILQVSKSAAKHFNVTEMAINSNRLICLDFSFSSQKPCALSLLQEAPNQKWKHLKKFSFKIERIGFLYITILFFRHFKSWRIVTGRVIVFS